MFYFFRNLFFFFFFCLSCLVVGCGEKKENSEPGKTVFQVEAENELISLRLKEIKRDDRLLDGVGREGSLTDLELGENIPDAEPGKSWGSEKQAGLVLDQLKRFARAKQVEDFEGVLAEGFQCSALMTKGEALELDERLQVVRGSDSPMEMFSRDRILEMLGALGKLKLKVLGVEDDGENVVTTVRVEGDGEEEYGADWICDWRAQGEDLLLWRLRVESSTLVNSEGTWFVDATQSAIGDNPRFDGQVMRGIEYWAQRITRIGDLAMTGHHGIAVGDVNGDGLEDVYACDGGSLPNQLYIQQADGTAKEMAAEWGVAWFEDSRSALLVDLDNDGDQDLVVATIAMIVFAENDGMGEFKLRGGFPGAPYPFSLSAADFDSDGDLDIYTCVYSAGDEGISGKRGFEATSPIPFNDANNGGRNVLLANLGDFQFGEVTEQVGLDQNNTRWSFAAAWEDVDRDGDPDLYVANDFGRNCFYRNDAGKFTEIAAELGLEDMAAGMSVAWGDYNRDGVADLQVGNMFSAAGSRVGYQRNYSDGMQRMARGNSLFAGKGGAFEDVSLAANVTGGGWAWSSALADLNNDGWQDIVVTNGYLTNTRDDDL